MCSIRVKSYENVMENCDTLEGVICAVGKMVDKQKKLSIEEEEILAVNVKNYPCLFDKTDKGYKEKDCIANAWEKIADSLEFIENGEYLTLHIFHEFIILLINF